MFTYHIKYVILLLWSTFIICMIYTKYMDQILPFRLFEQIVYKTSELNSLLPSPVWETLNTALSQADKNPFADESEGKGGFTLPQLDPWDQTILHLVNETPTVDCVSKQKTLLFILRTEGLNIVYS